MASRKWPSIERLQTINALDGSGVSSSRPRFAHGDGPLLLTDLPQDALDSIRSHPQLSCADYFRLPQASRVFRKRIDDHRCENAKRDAVGAYDRVQAENPQLMTRINGDFVEKLNQTFVNLLKKDDSEGDGIMEDVFGNQRFFNVLQIVGYTNPTKLAAIESFDFRGNYFAGDVMEGLCQVLCMKELRYQNVDVRTNKLFEEDATRLSTAILENIESGPKTIKFFNDISIEFMLNGPNRNRTEFDFSDMRRIGDVGCMVLAGLLTISKKRDRLPQYSTSGPPKIRINLKDNDITHVGLAALIRNVHLSGRMHVSLILTNNLIGPEGEKALADAIRETRLMENLDLLDLRFNPISRSISPMLSEEILNSKIKKFNEIPIKEMRQDERRITELDLSRRHIGVLGGQVLADHLPKMDSIRSINLKTNTLGPEGAKLLAPALRDSASLTSIDLGFNSFSSEGAEALAPAIRDSPSITSIDVGWNSIGQAASLELLAAMKGKRMVRIGMADCKLGVEGSKAVAEMISGMSSLTSIDLRDNHLTGFGRDITGLEAIADALALTSLTSIDLSLNSLASEGAKALAPAIRVSTSLTSINLGANRLGSEGAKALAPAIRDSTSLTSIDLYHNDLGADGAKALAPAIRESPSLTSINLRSNDLEDNVLLRKAVEGRSGFELML